MRGRLTGGRGIDRERMGLLLVLLEASEVGICIKVC